MIEKLKNEIKIAMRATDRTRLNVLRTILSDSQKIAIGERRKDITESDLISAVSTQIKRHNDSITQFTKGNRDDLADIEKAELEIYKDFQVKQMSEDDVFVLVDKAITDTGATTKKDMGRIIGLVNKDILKGTFDMKQLSKIVMSKLG